MPTNRISPEEFATLPHGQKQRVLAQLPSEYRGWLLDVLHGHEYGPFIYSLIPGYSTWPFLEAGGEPEHIVKAGEEGRRTGMEMVAGDPFNNYTSGSPLVVQTEILVSTKTSHRAVIRYGWQENQRQELRYPSVSLDAPVKTPDGEEHDLYEEIASPVQVGDPFQDILEKDALQGAFSKLTRETGQIVGEWLSGKDIAQIALQRNQEYEVVRVRIWRAMKELRKKLTRRGDLGFDREGAIDDGYRRLIEKIREDMPP